MKTTVLTVIVLLVIGLALSTEEESDAKAMERLGMDVAYNTVKTLVCHHTGDTASAAKHRRLREAFQTEIFARFSEADAVRSIEHGMEYYRHSPLSGC